MDVHIGEIQTNITVSDDATSLSPEALQRIVKIVLEKVKQHQDVEKQRQNDVGIEDRVYRKER